MTLVPTAVFGDMSDLFFKASFALAGLQDLAKTNMYTCFQYRHLVCLKADQTLITCVGSLPVPGHTRTYALQAPNTEASVLAGSEHLQHCKFLVAPTFLGLQGFPLSREAAAGGLHLPQLLLGQNGRHLAISLQLVLHVCCHGWVLFGKVHVPLRDDLARI